MFVANSIDRPRFLPRWALIFNKYHKTEILIQSMQTDHEFLKVGLIVYSFHGGAPSQFAILELFCGVVLDCLLLVRRKEIDDVENVIVSFSRVRFDDARLRHVRM